MVSCDEDGIRTDGGIEDAETWATFWFYAGGDAGGDGADGGVAGGGAAGV